MPQPPAPRPKVRARRGQATDPHSIAERVSSDISSTKLFLTLDGEKMLLFIETYVIFPYPSA